MNPSQAFANRTARLVAEAVTPVYSTSTPAPKAREHLSAVEVESMYGGRLWSHMVESEVDAFIDGIHESDSLSDIDHSAKCWCFRG